MEPPIVHTPRLGHNIIDLSTKDTVQGPKKLFPYTVVLIHFEPPKKDNLSTKDTTAELILSPKCLLFGGSTV